MKNEIIAYTCDGVKFRRKIEITKINFWENHEYIDHEINLESVEKLMKIMPNDEQLVVNEAGSLSSTYTPFYIFNENWVDLLTVDGIEVYARINNPFVKQMILNYKY